VPSLAIDERYRAEHTLRDGTRVSLRLLRRDDRERLREGFERLSPQSRYRRFMSPTPRLTEVMLDRLMAVDGRDHVAVAAARVGPDGLEGDGLGVARFIRLPDAPDTAEAAVAVVDEAQGRGLGGLLLTTLVIAARERGIRRFRCYVAASNDVMHALLGELGASVTPVDGGGLPGYDVELPAPSADERLTGSVLYRLFRLAATSLDVVLRVIGLGPHDAEPDSGTA
jgi:GNAT superfamily N-acetyltransferase